MILTTVLLAAQLAATAPEPKHIDECIGKYSDLTTKLPASEGWTYVEASVPQKAAVFALFNSHSTQSHLTHLDHVFTITKTGNPLALIVLRDGDDCVVGSHVFPAEDLESILDGTYTD